MSSPVFLSVKFTDADLAVVGSSMTDIAKNVADLVASYSMAKSFLTKDKYDPKDYCETSYTIFAMYVNLFSVYGTMASKMSIIDQEFDVEEEEDMNTLTDEQRMTLLFIEVAESFGAVLLGIKEHISHYTPILLECATISSIKGNKEAKEYLKKIPEGQGAFFESQRSGTFDVYEGFFAQKIAEVKQFVKTYNDSIIGLSEGNGAFGETKMINPSDDIENNCVQ